MPDTHDRGPARRGRKDPELAAALQETLALPAEEADERPDLLPDDEVECKITHEVATGDTTVSTFTYGVRSKVQEGEDEDEAFVRVANVVNDRVNRLIAAHFNNNDDDE